MIATFSLILLMYIVLWGLFRLSFEIDGIRENMYGPIVKLLSNVLNIFILLPIIEFLNKVFVLAVFLWIVTAIILTFQSVF